jgi:hypothetical protein
MHYLRMPLTNNLMWLVGLYSKIYMNLVTEKVLYLSDITAYFFCANAEPRYGYLRIYLRIPSYTIRLVWGIRETP